MNGVAGLRALRVAVGLCLEGRFFLPRDWLRQRGGLPGLSVRHRAWRPRAQGSALLRAAGGLSLPLPGTAATASRVTRAAALVGAWSPHCFIALSGHRPVDASHVLWSAGAQWTLERRCELHGPHACVVFSSQCGTVSSRPSLGFSSAVFFSLACLAVGGQSMCVTYKAWVDGLRTRKASVGSQVSGESAVVLEGGVSALTPALLRGPPLCSFLPAPYESARSGRAAGRGSRRLLCAPWRGLGSVACAGTRALCARSARRVKLGKVCPTSLLVKGNWEGPVMMQVTEAGLNRILKG